MTSPTHAGSLEQTLDAMVSATEVELDLTNLSLEPDTKDSFELLASLFWFAQEANHKYEEVRSREKMLEEFRYYNFGTSPEQVGKKFVFVEEATRDEKTLKKAFHDLLNDIVEEQGMDPRDVVLVNGEPIEMEWGACRVLTLDALEIEERGFTNIIKYKGRAKSLLDVGRATIVCRTEEEVVKIVVALQSRINVVRILNRFAQPAFTGLRYFLMKLKIQQYVFEVQVHLAQLLAHYKRRGGEFHAMCFPDTFLARTDELYRKRALTFHRIGQVVGTGDVTAGIVEILKCTDKELVVALEEVTDVHGLYALELNLKAKKRLLTLEVEGGNSTEVLRIINDIANDYRKDVNYEKFLEWRQRALEVELLDPEQGLLLYDEQGLFASDY
jgi:hypothetical protein